MCLCRLGVLDEYSSAHHYFVFTYTHLIYTYVGYSIHFTKRLYFRA